jgi:hypothetical protein
MIRHVFDEILGWPNGIVVGNLMASAILGTFTEWRLRVHHRKTREYVDKKANNEHYSS